MGRILTFLYGVIVYLIFFPTFVYLFAFVGDLFVPKTVSSGEPGPLWQALLINTALVAAFGVQHAIMARPGFKAKWTKIIPRSIERSTFVLIASGLLVLLMWQWRPIEGVIWHIETPVLRGVLYGLFGLGMVVTLLSSFLIDHFDLFGLRQVWLHLRGKPYTHKPFVLRSLYKVVRHPLMLGFLIAFWATPTMTASHLCFSLLFTTYIVLGVRIEERDLIAQHGESYRAYKRTTPGLLPLPKFGAAAAAGPKANATV